MGTYPEPPAIPEKNRPGKKSTKLAASSPATKPIILFLALLAVLVFSASQSSPTELRIEALRRMTFTGIWEDCSPPKAAFDGSRPGEAPIAGRLYVCDLARYGVWQYVRDISAALLLPTLIMCLRRLFPGRPYSVSVVVGLISVAILGVLGVAKVKLESGLSNFDTGKVIVQSSELGVLAGLRVALFIMAVGGVASAMTVVLNRIFRA